MCGRKLRHNVRKTHPQTTSLNVYPGPRVASLYTLPRPPSPPPAGTRTHDSVAYEDVDRKNSSQSVQNVGQGNWVVGWWAHVCTKSWSLSSGPLPVSLSPNRLDYLAEIYMSPVGVSVSLPVTSVPRDYFICLGLDKWRWGRNYTLPLITRIPPLASIY